MFEEEQFSFFDIIDSVFNSLPVLFLKVVIGIYCFVLIIDILLLLYMGNISSKLRQLKYGADITPKGGGINNKAWVKIHDKLDLNDETQWKVAILEAEDFLVKELRSQGYSGDSFLDILNNIPPGTFSSLEKVRQVHELRNKIVMDDNFELTHGQAIMAFEILEQFRRDMGVMN